MLPCFTKQLPWEYLIKITLFQDVTPYNFVGIVQVSSFVFYFYFFILIFYLYFYFLPFA